MVIRIEMVSTVTPLAQRVQWLGHGPARLKKRLGAGSKWFGS